MNDLQMLTDRDVRACREQLAAAKRKVTAAHESLMKASDEYDRVLTDVMDRARRSRALQDVVAEALQS